MPTACPVLQTGWTTATNSATVSSLSINKPSSVSTGDMLLLVAGNDDTGASPAFNAPTGSTFTEVFQVGSGTSDCHLGCWYRIADGTEGSTFTINNASNNEVFGWCGRITGHSATQAPYYLSAWSTIHDAGTAIAAGNSIDPDESNSLAIAMVAFDGGDGHPWTVASLYDDPAQTYLPGISLIAAIQAGTSGNDVCGAVAQANLFFSGYNGNFLFTNNGTSDGKVCAAIAIRNVGPVSEVGGMKHPDRILNVAGPQEILGVQWGT